jgi:uncharacterized Tic20 family protein
MNQTTSPGAYIDNGASSDDKNFSVLMHLSILAHLVFPYVAVAIPIIMWMNKREKSAFIDDHGREAINFHITISIYSFVLPIIGVIIAILTLGLGIIILIPLIFLPYVLSIVGMIMAIVHTNRGEYFRYPMTIRFIQPAE